MAALGGKVMGDDDVQGSLAVGPMTGFVCSRDETPEQLFTLFSLKNGNQSCVQSQGERRFSAGLGELGVSWQRAPLVGSYICLQ